MTRWSSRAIGKAIRLRLNYSKGEKEKECWYVDSGQGERLGEIRWAEELASCDPEEGNKPFIFFLFSFFLLLLLFLYINILYFGCDTTYDCY